MFQRVAEALQISRHTVRTIKERKIQNPVLSSPGKKRPRTKPKTEDLRESSKMEVRNTIYNMYKQSMLNFILFIWYFVINLLFQKSILLC